MATAVSIGGIDIRVQAWWFFADAWVVHDLLWEELETSDFQAGGG